MLRYIPVVIASMAVIACGVVHGFWTDRWVTGAEPKEAGDNLAKLPPIIGDWDGQAIESKSSQGDEVTGWLQRRYTNRKTGEAVTMAIVCGRPGPISSHTPDVCYGASGFTVGHPRRANVPGDKGEFWTADAIKGSATGETKLRIYWGWNDGSGWLAVDDARQTYPRSPVLHKLYVIREVSSSTKDENEPCLKFLQSMVPLFDKTVLRSDKN
jgi:hypothetical protein